MLWLTRTVALVFAGLICITQVSADKPAEKPRVKIEFRRAESKPAEGLIEAVVVGKKEKVYLYDEVELTNEDIEKAHARIDPDLKLPLLKIVFTKEGAKKMAKLSKGHLGKPLAILVDGKVVCAPYLVVELSDHAIISGSLTIEELERIAKGIHGK